MQLVTVSKSQASLGQVHLLGRLAQSSWHDLEAKSIKHDHSKSVDDPAPAPGIDNTLLSARDCHGQQTLSLRLDDSRTTCIQCYCILLDHDHKRQMRLNAKENDHT